jgi:PAS domain S-box-containing protein
MILPKHDSTLSEPGRSASSLMKSDSARALKRVVFLSLLALTLFFPSGTMGQQATRRVLILTGSDPNFPGFAVLTRGIQSTLRDRSRDRVELLYELQQSLAIDPESEAGDTQLISYLKEKYADKHIDLVLVFVARRFRLLAAKDPSLFAGIPKVFYDFDSEREASNRSMGPNITGVWASLDRHRETLELAFALSPQARKVIVVSGVSPTNKIVVERLQAEFRSYEGRAEFSYMIGEPVAEVKRQLAALDTRSIVIFSGFTSDKLGNVYTGPEVLSLVAPTSGAPIYGTTDTLMGLGITGGKLLDFEETGKRLGELTQRVLAGEKPEQIPQETGPSVMVVDWRELQRWGIGEGRLPSGTVVRFRQPSFWEVYKWYAFGLVAVVLVEAMLIGWLLVLRVRRRQAEEESLRLALLAEAEHKRIGEIVSNVPGIVWETAIDPDTKELKTTFISDYLRKMLGYTPDEWIANSPGLGLRMMPEEDRERANRDSEAVIASGKEGITQFRWRGKNGQTVWTESYLSPMSNGNGVIGLRGVTLDITQRKLAEVALRHAEEKDRAILNAIPDLMFMQTRDGVFLDYHAKDPKHLFAPPETFLGQNMHDVLPPELADQFAVCFERAEEMGEPQILEYKLTIDETTRWFEARMVRTGNNILSVVRDITQRLFIESALQKNEAQLAGIIESAMDAIITVDENLIIILFNSAAEKTFGCPASEAMGQPLDRFLPERFRASHSENIGTFDARPVMERLMGQSGNFLGLRNSGEEFPLEASISAVDLSGQRFYTIILRDITERKAAEEALQAERALLKVVVHYLPASVCLIGSDLRLQIVNPAYQAIAPGKEMIGKTLDEVWAETGQDLTTICRRVLETGEPHEVTDELNTIRRTTNGPLEPAYFSWSLHRVRLPGGDGWGLLNAAWETTERKKAEDALRESEERFGKAFIANPQPMSITTIADGRYVDVNESFLSVSGFTRKEVIGRTSMELNIWETAKSRADFIQQVKERGSVVNVETRLRTRDGSRRLLLSSAERLDLGGVECLLMASSDITERMRAQQALQESEARFRNMADTAPVMIYVTGADKLCTYVNQQWCEFTGRPMELELGHGWTEGIHPDDHSRCLETYVNAFDRREPFRMEYRIRGADGAFHWVFDSGTPRFSTTGEFLGYIGSCMDITARKESEESLRLAHAEVSRLKNQLQEENIYLQEEIKLGQNFGEIVGASAALKYVLFKIEQVAPTDSTVLITGETGTGKELIARAIHSASSRRDRPLVKVNCAALSASLIESELFGHEKGAFTGAVARKIGRFELADGATIFLDEIGELPIDLQVKLLRVIQEGEFERLGSSKTIKADVRIIAATNRHLEVDVKKGLFREDLWFRLNVFPITVPPLRDRREDIPLLVDHLVSVSAKKLGRVISSISPATMRSLSDYPWPGNVRELSNVIERAVINSHGSVLRVVEEFEEAPAETSISSTKTLDEMEREYIVRILEDQGWRIEGRRGAARILGIHPSTLRGRMLKFGIHKSNFTKPNVSDSV